MKDAYPFEEVERLEEDPVDIESFSYEELRHLLQTLKAKRPDDHDLILIWSRTGLRQGEILALKWGNVDCFDKKLMIHETRHPTSSAGPPKTSHSVREIDLNSLIIEAPKRQEADTGLTGTLVFLRKAGKPFTDAFMTKRFRHLLRLAGFKYRHRNRCATPSLPST